jgi:hypothetical protein
MASTTNQKVSIAVATTIGVGILGIGLLGGSVFPTNGVFGDHKKAVITMDGERVCRQYVDASGGRVKDAYPDIYRPSWWPITLGDSISWTGEKQGVKTNNVDVVFPVDASPFKKPDFHHGEDSSTVVSGAAAGDFSFSSVTIDGTACSAFSDPGVHVTR